MMILVVESGSSHTDWRFIEDGAVVAQERTSGLHPYFQTRREISRSIRLGLAEEYFHKKLQHIYFYGAGCDTEVRKNTVKASLTSQFRSPVTVESNLIGAARGLYQGQPGIACILDNGSNSCLFDGKSILKSVRPGGFILGDEGSGAAIGKAFLSDILKNLAPATLAATFYYEHHTTADEVMETVYNTRQANFYLTRTALFLSPYQGKEYVHNLIVENFRNFFRRNISQYAYHDYPVSFVGNIAATYSTLLREVCKEFEIKPEVIVESAMDGLVAYHISHDRPQ